MKRYVNNIVFVVFGIVFLFLFSILITGLNSQVFTGVPLTVFDEVVYVQFLHLRLLLTTFMFFGQAISLLFVGVEIVLCVITYKAEKKLNEF